MQLVQSLSILCMGLATTLLRGRESETKQIASQIHPCPISKVNNSIVTNSDIAILHHHANIGNPMFVTDFVSADFSIARAQTHKWWS